MKKVGLHSFSKRKLLALKKSNLVEVQEVKESNFFNPGGWGSSNISVCLMSIYIHSSYVNTQVRPEENKCMSCTISQLNLYYFSSNQAMDHSWKRILSQQVSCQRAFDCFPNIRKIYTYQIRS